MVGTVQLHCFGVCTIGRSSTWCSQLSVTFLCACFLPGMWPSVGTSGPSFCGGQFDPNVLEPILSELQTAWPSYQVCVAVQRWWWCSLFLLLLC